MDATQIKKIQAMNRYKRRQFIENLYFYSLTALTCSLFCCVTLCLPYFSSMVKDFFFDYMSSLIPVLFGSKLLFILCNLIIVVLMKNSRILSSDYSSSSTSDVYYDEYIIQSCQATKPQIESQTQIPRVNKAKTFEKHVEESVNMTAWEDELKLNTLEFKNRVWIKETRETWQAKKEENLDEGDGQNSNLVASSSDELNKRAEDFIARVNRHRKLELRLLQYGTTN